MGGIHKMKYLLTYPPPSNSWVFSTQMPPEQTVGHTLFDPTKSTTFQPLEGQKFAISYGDGSFALGVVGMDTVEIGGAAVQTQAVELATNVSASFVAETVVQGLVGLAFSKINTGMCSIGLMPLFPHIN
jgi:Eukaryotic aspartyl protease